MANMIDLDSFPKLSQYFHWEKRSLFFFKIFQNAILVPSLIIPSILNLQFLMSCFNDFFNVIFTINSPFVPCILSNVDVKPADVLQLFFDHPNSTWEHVNIILSPNQSSPNQH